MAGKGSVLFIGPAFFGYEVSIADAIRANGYECDFFDERSSNKSIYKAIFRVKKSVLTTIINKYYKTIDERIKNKKYDFLFLIKGEVIPEWFIKAFQQYNPTARLIYYTYDSFNNNNKNSVYILKHFNACYSFDFEDVKKYPGLKLKHLFYTPEYINLQPGAEKKNTIAFVGTLHSNRYKVIKSLFSGFSDTFIFYFSPAKWHFLMDKTLKKDFKKIKWTEVSFDKLSKQQVADIFKASASVLDIQRFGQTGLTMRTFEVLAAGSILITTNTYIKQADFYNTHNIVVVEDLNSPQNTAIVQQRIDAKPAALLPGAFEKYNVNNWVKEFFE